LVLKDVNVNLLRFFIDLYEVLRFVLIKGKKKVQGFLKIERSMRRWSSFFPFWLGIGSPHQAINFEATNYITKIKTALGNLSMLGGPLKSRRPELGFSGARFFF